MKIKEKFVNLVYISSLPKCCCTACPTYIHVLNWTISESEGSWKILGIDSLKILSNQQTKLDCQTAITSSIGYDGWPMGHSHFKSKLFVCNDVH